jgi:uncharacterized membrane protein YqaE (UPF0057 family)
MEKRQRDEARWSPVAKLSVGCAILIAILAVGLFAGFTWDLLFGIAYCLDGYHCPWN